MPTTFTCITQSFFLSLISNKQAPQRVSGLLRKRETKIHTKLWNLPVVQYKLILQPVCQPIQKAPPKFHPLKSSRFKEVKGKREQPSNLIHMSLPFKIHEPCHRFRQKAWYLYNSIDQHSV